jgi:hypothetical protein
MYVAEEGASVELEDDSVTGATGVVGSTVGTVEDSDVGA